MRRPLARRVGRPFSGLLVAATAIALLAGALLLTGLSGTAPADAEATAEDSVAVGFSRDMAVHHQQAVEMSLSVLRNGTSAEVRTLAYDIANTQAAQRGMMLGWLQLWGRTATTSGPPMRWMDMPPTSAEDRRRGVLMPGMASRADMAALAAARGHRADALYLRLMIAHHRGGVHMAEAVVADGSPQVVHRMAREMVRSQQTEIDLMKSLAKRLGDAEDATAHRGH
ncbi:DUF305 domain-containing protein [Streptomyces sp. NPDC000134]|uniref:DUF305 domain-containing protein n=1 Tax=Streptomyces sp. NPDC000134 TaxID=3364536 RepID=UPI003675D637